MNRYPNTVEGLNNTSYFYYYKKLYRMIYSIYEFTIPDTWDKDYMIEHIFLKAPLCVTDTEYGVLPLECAYNGINVFGKPTRFQINNPVLRELINGVIGVDGVMLHIGTFNNGYESLDDLITRYAVMLSEVDASMQTTLMNSRVAHVFSATSTTQLKALQKLYDKITRGEPAVFLRKTPDESADHVLFNNVKNSFIGIELQDFKRGVINEFLSEIGINNSNTNKKERLITDEVNSNNSELSANIYKWFDNIKRCFDDANAMFGLNLSVKLNEKVLQSYEKEVSEDVQSD